MKKIISVAIAALMLLSVFSTVAFAEVGDVTTLEFTIQNTQASLGSEIKVPLYVKSESTIMVDGEEAGPEGIGCTITYDPAVLTYGGYESPLGIKSADLNIENPEAGVINVYVISGQPPYDAVVFNFKFTGPATMSEEVSKIETDVKVQFLEDSSIDGDQLVILEDAQTFNNGVVTIVKEHSAPVIGGVSIEGTGVVGKTLTATVSNFSDNWNLTPEYEYSWTIDGTEVGTGATYTPDASDIGEDIKVTVTATVSKDGEAVDNNESAPVTSDAKTITADPEAKASVSEAKLNPEAPRAGSAVKVDYTFTPSVNGGEDASEIKWYNAAEGEEPAELTGKVSEDGKTYTPSTEDVTNGVVLGATITPKGSLDTAEGDAVDVKASAPVAKKKKSGSSSIDGPSLAPSKQNNDDDNNNGNNSGTTDKDKFILTIDKKEAYVWGETKVSDKAPIISDANRTMLPIRFVAENLGFTVDWDEATKTVTITKGDDVLTLVIDSDAATVNGKEVKLDSPAYIDVEASRTMVPLRFIAENLGYDVEWVETTRQVIITK
jgi:hypothetical protein